MIDFRFITTRYSVPAIFGSLAVLCAPRRRLIGMYVGLCSVFALSRSLILDVIRWYKILQFPSLNLTQNQMNFYLSLCFQQKTTVFIRTANHQIRRIAVIYGTDVIWILQQTKGIIRFITGVTIEIFQSVESIWSLRYVKDTHSCYV